MALNAQIVYVSLLTRPLVFRINKSKTPDALVDARTRLCCSSGTAQDERQTQINVKDRDAVPQLLRWIEVTSRVLLARPQQGSRDCGAIFILARHHNRVFTCET